MTVLCMIGFYGWSLYNRSIALTDAITKKGRLALVAVISSTSTGKAHNFNSAMAAIIGNSFPEIVVTIIGISECTLSLFYQVLLGSLPIL